MKRPNTISLDQNEASKYMLDLPYAPANVLEPEFELGYMALAGAR